METCIHWWFEGKPSTFHLFPCHGASAFPRYLPPRASATSAGLRRKPPSKESQHVTTLYSKQHLGTAQFSNNEHVVPWWCIDFAEFGMTCAFSDCLSFLLPVLSKDRIPMTAPWSAPKRSSKTWRSKGSYKTQMTSLEKYVAIIESVHARTLFLIQLQSRSWEKLMELSNMFRGTLTRLNEFKAASFTFSAQSKGMLINTVCSSKNLLKPQDLCVLNTAMAIQTSGQRQRSWNMNWIKHDKTWIIWWALKASSSLIQSCATMPCCWAMSMSNIFLASGLVDHCWVWVNMLNLFAHFFPVSALQKGIHRSWDRCRLHLFADCLASCVPILEPDTKSEESHVFASVLWGCSKTSGPSVLKNILYTVFHWVISSSVVHKCSSHLMLCIDALDPHSCPQLIPVSLEAARDNISSYASCFSNIRTTSTTVEAKKEPAKEHLLKREDKPHKPQRTKIPPREVILMIDTTKTLEDPRPYPPTSSPTLRVRSQDMLLLPLPG